ncbi:unnamed protein product [Amoebophrya sp. A120]|nr:unnamed protein product [Amoebophrya sp. A120]|eukprot:GSA120T00021396001.1
MISRRRLIFFLIGQLPLEDYSVAAYVGGETNKKRSLRFPQHRPHLQDLKMQDGQRNNQLRNLSGGTRSTKKGEEVASFVAKTAIKKQKDNYGLTERGTWCGFPEFQALLAPASDPDSTDFACPAYVSGFAFSGGGSRAAGLVGAVLKVYHDEELRLPEYVTGVSGGTWGFATGLFVPGPESAEKLDANNRTGETHYFPGFGDQSYPEYFIGKDWTNSGDANSFGGLTLKGLQDKHKQRSCPSFLTVGFAQYIGDEALCGNGMADCMCSGCDMAKLVDQHRWIQERIFCGAEQSPARWKSLPFEFVQYRDPLTHRPMLRRKGLPFPIVVQTATEKGQTLKPESGPTEQTAFLFETTPFYEAANKYQSSRTAEAERAGLPPAAEELYAIDRLHSPRALSDAVTASSNLLRAGISEAFGFEHAFFLENESMRKVDLLLSDGDVADALGVYPLLRRGVQRVVVTMNTKGDIRYSRFLLLRRLMENVSSSSEEGGDVLLKRDHLLHLTSMEQDWLFGRYEPLKQAFHMDVPCWHACGLDAATLQLFGLRTRPDVVQTEPASCCGEKTLSDEKVRELRDAENAAQDAAVARRQVFAPEAFLGVAEALESAVATGYGAVATVKLRTIENKYLQIPAGREVLMTFISPTNSRHWVRERSETVKSLLNAEFSADVERDFATEQAKIQNVDDVKYAAFFRGTPTVYPPETLREQALASAVEERGTVADKAVYDFLFNGGDFGEDVATLQIPAKMFGSFALESRARSELAWTGMIGRQVDTLEFGELWLTLAEACHGGGFGEGSMQLLSSNGPNKYNSLELTGRGTYFPHVDSGGVTPLECSFLAMDANYFTLKNFVTHLTMDLLDAQAELERNVQIPATATEAERAKSFSWRDCTDPKSATCRRGFYTSACDVTTESCIPMRVADALIEKMLGTPESSGS